MCLAFVAGPGQTPSALSIEAPPSGCQPPVCSTASPQAAYELFEEAVAALPPGPQHLVVLSGVPLIFPTVGAAADYFDTSCSQLEALLHAHWHGAARAW